MKFLKYVEIKISFHVAKILQSLISHNKSKMKSLKIIKYKIYTSDSKN